MEARARRANTLVGFLRASGFGGVLLGLGGEELVAEMVGDGVAGGGDALLRQRHRIGSHIGDVAVLVQALGRAHHGASTHAEAIAGGLLQGRGGERRLRAAAVRLGFHRHHSEIGGLQRRSHGGGTSLIKLANVRREPVRGQLAVGTEILGAGESLAAERDHAGGEFGTLPQRVRRGQRGDDIPVRCALERHAFALAFHDQAGGHGLHAAGGQAWAHLAPQHRRQLIAVQTVEDAAGLLCVDHIAIHIARVVQGGVDGVLGDLVEHHALDRHLGFQGLHQVPRDGLALAILISRQIEFIGVLQGRFEFADRTLLVAVDNVIRLEPVVDVHAELAELGLVCRGHLAGLREVSDMADRRHDGVPLAQVVTDLVGLGRRLHNHQFGSHTHSLCIARNTRRFWRHNTHESCPTAKFRRCAGQIRPFAPHVLPFGRCRRSADQTQPA